MPSSLDLRRRVPDPDTDPLCDFFGVRLGRTVLSSSKLWLYWEEESMKRLAWMIVSVALVESGAATGCRNPTSPSGDGTPAFSASSISVDKNKVMTNLTTDERASTCAEFSRALTANFGSKAVGCTLKALFAESQSS